MMRIDAKMLGLPVGLLDWLGDASMTDVSGHSGDRMYFVDRMPPVFLKVGPKGKFARAALLQRYWAERGLSSRVVSYISDDRDYLVTEPVAGTDGIAAEHLAQPERLARVFGESLRVLHGVPFADCPVQLMPQLLEEAKKRAFQQWHMDDLKPFIGGASSETAAKEVLAGAHLLRTDALLHGDYCLPNIMLDGWRLSGFIDIAEGGAGDRHYDIAWGLWTIMFNLKDVRYGEAFLDAYGRDAIDPARLRICALLASME